MEAIGVVRRIDELGRVVIPKELRDAMNLPTNTPMNITAKDNAIILRAFRPHCMFCGKEDALYIMGARICEDCAKKMYENLGGVL